MVHTIPAFVALALIIQILIIQICCTTEDDWPLVGASDRSGHCSTGTCAVRSESRAAAHVTGTVYSLPNLIGLSPWHGTVTGADSESYWLTLVLPGRTGPSMQPRARSPRHAELQQRLSPGLPGLESMHAQRIMRSLSCRPHRCSRCGCIPTAHPSESASVLTPHGLCY